MVGIEALAEWNPWWRDGTVPAALHGRARREANRILSDLSGPRAAVLTGIRRGGKSTLMYQVIKEVLADGVEPHRVLYVNLEDIAFDGSSLDGIVAAYRQAFAPVAPQYLFFDEVQAHEDWARFVRVVVDQKRHRIAVTGSTASLLAGGAGRLLTGRHATTQVRPLSFPEFLTFHRISMPRPPLMSEEGDAFVHHLDRFLDRGGFPQPNLEDDARSRTTLSDYFSDILERDVAVPGALESPKVRRLGGYLAKTLARPHTKSSLQRATGLSREAIRSYLDALAAAFLVQPCTRFVWSPKPEAEEQAPVKYYLADPALRGASAPKDRGRLAENVLANALQAQGGELRYWRDSGHEVDFVVPRGDVVDALQVTYGEGIPSREVKGLHAFWETLPKARRGARVILTQAQEGELEGIALVPLWRWLIEQEPGALE